ncbi:MAG: glycosyltransferase [Gammaproteobacteria bacterium]
MKNVLMIAFHYPPVQGSSGVQRSLKFSHYLADHDWTVQVLSAHPRAYRQTSNDQMPEIPKEVNVKRAFAADTGRHLSIKGRYPQFLSLPDRWVSWLLGAVPSGLAMIRKKRPTVLWSTYPIATAHLIGLALHRLTGIPWVADFRDSMTEEHYPKDKRTRNVFRWIERRTVKYATKVVFTTQGTREMYAQRYPELPASRWVCIENGYDEENFRAAIERIAQSSKSPKRDRVRLVHSGILYRLDRDPEPFFIAIKNLLELGKLTSGDLEVVLRASGHDDEYRALIKTHGLEAIVTLEQRIPYADALAEMMEADGLLIFQGSGCNHQIPAKVYECMRSGRPILALTDPIGDTARVLTDSGIDTMASLDDTPAIQVALLDFLNKVRGGSAPLPNQEYVEGFSRRSKAAELSAILDEVSSS